MIGHPEVQLRELVPLYEHHHSVLANQMGNFGVHDACRTGGLTTSQTKNVQETVITVNFLRLHLDTPIATLKPLFLLLALHGVDTIQSRCISVAVDVVAIILSTDEQSA